MIKLKKKKCPIILKGAEKPIKYLHFGVQRKNIRGHTKHESLTVNSYLLTIITITINIAKELFLNYQD